MEERLVTGITLASRFKRLRWLIATLLFIATVINYIDRQTLSIAIPVIRDELGITNSDYSRIVFSFLLAYTIMQVVSGKLIDRLGTKKGFSLFISWWSTASLLHVFANTVFGFGFFRFLLGMGEAGNWPGAVKAIAEWFPPKERALAAGFFNSGSSIGAVLAPPLISWIIIARGWREAFVITGALGFVWLAAWLYLYQVPELHPRITDAELSEITEGRDPSAVAAGNELRWIDLFRYRQLWGLLMARILSDPVWWFYVFWLPEYLKRQRSFSIAMIGMFGWIPFLFADLGNFVGGGASSFLIKRGWGVGRARKTVMCISAGAMIAGIPAVLTSNVIYSLALISVVTLAYSSWAANLITLPTDMFPKEVVASVYGIAGTAAGIGGMAFTLITGVVVDRFSYVPIFIAAGLLPIFAAAALVLLIGKVETIVRERKPSLEPSEQV
jgi:ACS family hexuronate transporter-like MFS transporter